MQKLEILKKGLLAEADNLVSNTPGYVLIKSLVSNHSVILSKRAEEFIKFIDQNSTIFKDEIIGSEYFISGISKIFKSVLEEYVEYKRLRLMGILTGFVTSDQKDDFELDRILNVFSILSIKDFELLKNFDSILIDPSSYHYKSSSRKQETYSNLINLGIISRNEKIEEKDIKITSWSSSTRELKPMIESLNTVLKKSKSPLRYQIKVNLKLSEFGVRMKNYIFSE